jgi:hypothetical protein
MLFTKWFSKKILMSGISLQQKKDPRKKEKKGKGPGLKSKRGKTSFAKLHVSKKKKRGWDVQVFGWDSIEKERKITFFL